MSTSTAVRSRKSDFVNAREMPRGAIIVWLATSGVETAEVVAATSEALTAIDGSLSRDQMPRIKPVIAKQLKIESQSLSVNIGARTNLPLGIRIMFDIAEVAPVRLDLVGAVGASLSKRDRMLRRMR
jgi:hypothetical protein